MSSPAAAAATEVQVSSFLALPPELRNKIYESVIAAGQEVDLSQSCPHVWDELFPMLLASRKTQCFFKLTFNIHGRLVHRDVHALLQKHYSLRMEYLRVWAPAPHNAEWIVRIHGVGATASVSVKTDRFDHDRIRYKDPRTGRNRYMPRNARLEGVAQQLRTRLRTLVRASDNETAGFGLEGLEIVRRALSQYLRGIPTTL